jgi:hypothetical protein
MLLFATFLSLLLCAHSKDDFTCSCDDGIATLDVDKPKGDYWVGVYTETTLHTSVGCSSLKKGSAIIDISDYGTQTLYVVNVRLRVWCQTIVCLSSH